MAEMQTTVVETMNGERFTATSAIGGRTGVRLEENILVLQVGPTASTWRSFRFGSLQPNVFFIPWTNVKFMAHFVNPDA